MKIRGIVNSFQSIVGVRSTILRPPSGSTRFDCLLSHRYILTDRKLCNEGMRERERLREREVRAASIFESILRLPVNVRHSYWLDSNATNLHHQNHYGSITRLCRYRDISIIIVKRRNFRQRESTPGVSCLVDLLWNVYELQYSWNWKIAWFQGKRSFTTVDGQRPTCIAM